MKLTGRNDRRHSLYEVLHEDELEESMRKLIVAAFISVDGVIQAPGGPEEDPSGGFHLGGWIVPYAGEATGQAVQNLAAVRVGAGASYLRHIRGVLAACPGRIIQPRHR